MIAYEIPPIYTMGSGGKLRFAAAIRLTFSHVSAVNSPVRLT